MKRLLHSMSDCVRLREWWGSAAAPWTSAPSPGQTRARTAPAGYSDSDTFVSPAARHILREVRRTTHQETRSALLGLVRAVDLGERLAPPQASVQGSAPRVRAPSAPGAQAAAKTQAAPDVADPYPGSVPLGRVQVGTDLQKIVTLRMLAWQRNPLLFQLDDRTLCMACTASTFSVPVYYDLKRTDSVAHFRDIARLLARWVCVADEHARFINSLSGRYGGLKPLRPLLLDFVQHTYLPYLPEALHGDGTTMAALAVICHAAQLDAAELPLGSGTLAKHAAFQAACSAHAARLQEASLA